MELPDGLLSLLRQPSYCFLATTMPAGSPHLTQTWVDTDGTHVILNCVKGSQKVRNIERDPRVALNIVDAQNPFRYYAIRGRVVDVTTEGAADHIDELAERYTGKPYQWYGGRDQIRLIITVRPTRISSTG